MSLMGSLAGFPKPHAWWYVAKWLVAHAPEGGRGSAAMGSPNVAAPPFVRIVSLLDQLVPTADDEGQCVLATIGSQPVATLRLHVNECVQGVRPLDATAGDDGIDTATVQWRVPCVPAAPSQAAVVSTGASTSRPVQWRMPAGTRIEVHGLSANGTTIASHLLVSPSAASRLQLTIDAPSPASGTGERLLLDGRDVALIGAALVSDDGALVSDATARVSFRVLSGPGRVVGTGNGNPHSHEPLFSASVAAFGGLARGLVQAAADCSSEHAELLRRIDTDGGVRTPLVGAEAAASPIVVEASALLGGRHVSSTVAIPLSCDAHVDSALAVARRYGQGAALAFNYMRDFQG